MYVLYISIFSKMPYFLLQVPQTSCVTCWELKERTSSTSGTIFSVTSWNQRSVRAGGRFWWYLNWPRSCMCGPIRAVRLDIHTYIQHACTYYSVELNSCADMAWSGIKNLSLIFMPPTSVSHIFCSHKPTVWAFYYGLRKLSIKLDLCAEFGIYSQMAQHDTRYPKNSE